MSRESPLEITHLRDRLRQDFTGRLPDVTSSSLEERERNFLSRALAAFAVQRLSGCTVDEAAVAVVDSSGDSGIDAIHYAPASHRLWVVQSKFFADGQGEPALGDVSKFRNGLEALLHGQFDVFRGNAALERKVPQLQDHFNDSSLEVRAILVYSGIHLVSEDRIRLFEALRHRFSPDSDYFAFQRYNLTSIHGWLTGEHEGVGVDVVDITLHHPGQVSTPFETYYGLISLTDVATLYTTHGQTLIAANIRNYKGSTEVNDQILATIRDEPENFFYLNNGLTAYCERLEVHNLDRANTQRKRLTVYGFSIVNGAQTVGSIAAFFASNPQPLPQGYAFLKIISLQRSPDEHAFAQRITQSTNFQNQIGLRDFVALDEEQERIAAHLELSGILYHFKDSADTPSPDASNFTLEEATTALACLESDPECDFCARVLSNRRSLWSLEVVFPETAEIRSRYHRLFRPDRSARTVWRAVQARRAVVERMQENTRASTGKRKEFFENARWLVLHLVFLNYHPERGEALALSAGELDVLRQGTDHVSETLWAFTAAATDTMHDFRQTVQERNRIAQMLFGGFQRCLYTNQKFQSDSERRLAIILDREALKWFKPARGQFQLYYKLGTDHLEYQPDFVAETVDYIYMLEAKARNDLHDVEVQSKKDAAVQWCSHATRHAVSNDGKPWQYLLIPHDVTTENMTIAGLASQFRVE